MNLRRSSFPENEGILLFTIFYFLVYFGLIVNTQPGIRHLILIFPLVYVLKREWVIITLDHKYKKWLAVVDMFYSMATFYVYYSNLISYSDELMIDKKKACTIMADSNSDYGEGNKRFILILNYPRPSRHGKLISGVNY